MQLHILLHSPHFRITTTFNQVLWFVLWLIVRKGQTCSAQQNNLKWVCVEKGPVFSLSSAHMLRSEHEACTYTRGEEWCFLFSCLSCSDAIRWQRRMLVGIFKKNWPTARDQHQRRSKDIFVLQKYLFRIPRKKPKGQNSLSAACKLHFSAH